MFEWRSVRFLLFGSVLLLGACQGDDSAADAVQFPDDDPRETMVALVEARENQDFQAIYDLLISDYQRLDPEGEISDLSLFRMYPGTNQVDDWAVEEHDTFVVVRDAVRSPVASVFRPEDGSWQFDPGNQPFVVAYHEDILAGEGSPFPSAAEDYNAGWEHVDGPEGSEALIDRPWVLAVIRGDDHVDLTIELGAGPSRDYGAVDEIVFPLDGIYWSNSDGEGEVIFEWTRAVIDEDTKRMVGWPREDGEQGQIMAYQSTFRLLGVPDDADRVTLHFDEVKISAAEPEAQFTVRGYVEFTPETSHAAFDQEPD
jgi:hypothetical protein